MHPTLVVCIIVYIVNLTPVYYLCIIDGHELAAKLSKSISKKSGELQSLLRKYNSSTSKPLSWSDVTDLTSHLWLHGMLDSPSQIPNSVKLQAFHLYHRILRAREGVGLLISEMKNAVKYLEHDRDVLLDAATTHQNTTSDTCYTLGVVACLKRAALDSERLLLRYVNAFTPHTGNLNVECSLVYGDCALLLPHRRVERDYLNLPLPSSHHGDILDSPLPSPNRGVEQNDLESPLHSSHRVYNLDSPLPSPHGGVKRDVLDSPLFSNDLNSLLPSPHQGDDLDSPLLTPYRGDDLDSPLPSPHRGDDLDSPLPSPYRWDDLDSPLPCPHRGVEQDVLYSPVCSPSPHQGDDCLQSPHQVVELDHLDTSHLLPDGCPESDEGMTGICQCHLTLWGCYYM